MALGTPAITATLHSSGRAVSISASCSGATYLTVRRVVSGFDSLGEPRFYVRGMRKYAGTSVSGFDVDFPQNKAIGYAVAATDGTTTATASTVALDPIDLGADYLLGLDDEAAGVPVVVESLANVVKPTRQSVIRPLGRRDPLAVGDRRQYATFDLTVWTFGLTNRTLLESLLDRYAVLSFSPRYPDRMGLVAGGAFFVAVGDVEPAAPDGRSDVAERRWRLPCAQTGAPYGPLVTSIPTGWASLPNLEA